MQFLQPGTNQQSSRIGPVPLLRAEAAQDQYEKIAGWFRVAEIASERLSDAAELQAALKSVLVVDPANLDAIDQLEQSYTGSEMWEEKAELLLLKLDLSVDVYEQGDLYEAIAMAS